MKKSVLLLTAAALSVSLFTGCSKSSNVPPNTEVVTEVSTTAQMTTEAVTTEAATTPAPHTHTYTETITTEAACVADGVKTYSCECGDSYTETIPATGHTYGTYTYNDDATYTYDGTESAACLSCGHSDVRVAAGTMLSYTYTDMDATMYAQQTVNIRSLPNADGEKLGSLSANDEVNVTGQCTETSWYRIEYNGNVAYVSNDYLGADKVVVEQPTTGHAQTSDTVQNSNTASGNIDRTYAEAHAYFSSKYPMDVLIYNNDGSISFYEIISHGPSRDGAVDVYTQAKNALYAQGYSTVSSHADTVEKLRGADGYGQWSLYYWTSTGSN